MHHVLIDIGHSFREAFFMLWETLWALVLGFGLSGAVQAFVSRAEMERLLGRSGPREIALASLFGAASSSCSYAAAAMSKSLFSKGAGFIPSLAFLFASTNLVVELGIVLWLLLGWQFTAAEWLGGVILIAVMSVLVRVLVPQRLVDDARAHLAAAGGHDHGSMEGPTLVPIAQNFAMDVSMLWWDVVLGLLIAGALAAFVPDAAWGALALHGAPPALQALGGALAGPLIAVVSFVCSIGNVPLAAVLWSGGLPFAGVIAFLYGDLIVLPLLDVYRRYYGLAMALYIAAIFYVTMALAALVIDALFRWTGLVPTPNPNALAQIVTFSVNYTFWLNLAAALLAGWFVVLARRNPMHHHHHHHHGQESPEVPG